MITPLDILSVESWILLGTALVLIRSVHWNVLLELLLYVQAFYNA